MRCHQRRATTAKCVEHDVVFVAAHFNNAFEKFERFLSGVAEALAAGAYATEHVDIVPPTAQRDSLALIEIPFLIGHARLAINKTTLFGEPFHVFLAVTPCSRNPVPFIDRTSFRRAARPGHVRFVIESAGALLDVLVPRVDSGLGQRIEFRIECVGPSTGVIEDAIMHTAKMFRSLADVAFGIASLPHDLIDEIVLSHDLVEHHLDVMGGVPVAVVVE